MLIVSKTKLKFVIMREYDRKSLCKYNLLTSLLSQILTLQCNILMPNIGLLSN